jgi:hypothetical protein
MLRGFRERIGSAGLVVVLAALIVAPAGGALCASRFGRKLADPRLTQGLSGSASPSPPAHRAYPLIFERRARRMLEPPT